jgi:hypothetical protein
MGFMDNLRNIILIMNQKQEEISMLKQKLKKGTFLLTIMFLFSILMVSPQIVIADEDYEDPPEIEPLEIDVEKKKLVLATEDFSIEINGGGQIPFYHFNTTSDEASFFLKFQRIVQYNDTNNNNIFDNNELVGDSLSTLALTSVDWEVEMISESISEVDFAFVSSQIRNPLFSDVEIKLVNYFTAGSPNIKFDVEITNWPFVEEATGLSLEFEFLWSSNSEGPADEEGEPTARIYKESTNSGIYIKNIDDEVLAFFESVSEVTVDGVLDSQGATLSDTAVENAPRLNIYLNYPKFNDYILHDPTFGTSLAAILPLKDPSTIVSWFQENVKAGFLGITAMTSIVLATLFVLNRRKRI